MIAVSVLIIISLTLNINCVEIKNECSPAESCGACIQNPKCSWCKDELFIKNVSRCDYVEDHKTQCEISQLINPQNSRIIKKNKELSDPKDKNFVQMAPQEVDLKLRPGIPYQLKIAFREAADYPIDMYVLMDLSFSMKDDKENLAKLTNHLLNEMSKISNNFRIGFGSFVDKVTMPFTSTVPEKLISPCAGCGAPYGFINHMSLSDKFDQLQQLVDEIPISGNLDSPEGGFDALVQTIVCGEKIGWRDVSRKLILFITDADFHFAGDGKLGGIIKPNDGLCHLDSRGLYTESLTMDYPSLSQLKEILEEKKMSLIFAVTKYHLSTYNRLSEYLGNAVTGKLYSDSSNIVALIKEQYNAITSVVTLNDDADKNYLKVSYHSQCLHEPNLERRTCIGLTAGQTVNFDVQIELKKCPVDVNLRKQKFLITPTGTKDSLVINLEMICECDCEKPESKELKSSKCNSVGTYQCGICECPNDRLGDTCQCRKYQSTDLFDPKCINPITNLVCSNQGYCNCGECQCNNNNVYGQWCQCRDDTCDKHNHKLCNGKGHCMCDRCVCEPGWIGQACECPNDAATCIAPDEQLPCSGRGNCECGRCKCFPPLEDEPTFSGSYCEKCLDCQNTNLCAFYGHCILCLVFNSGRYNREDCRMKCGGTYDLVHREVKKYIISKLDPLTIAPGQRGEELCKFNYNNNCTVTFAYKQNEKFMPYFRVEKALKCSYTRIHHLD